jgi:hypothetical protein
VKFMDVHNSMVGISAEALVEAHAADLAIPDDEGVLRIHERAGHQADEIYELPVTV